MRTYCIVQISLRRISIDVAAYGPSHTIVRPRYRREYSTISIYITKSWILDIIISCDLVHETLPNTRPAYWFRSGAAVKD
jgi:hypothetical protein